MDYSVLDGQHDVESVVCALCKDEKIYEHRLDHENIGADFRFEVPGQSSVGLIGGGRGQWLGGTMASVEHEPIMGVWGRSPLKLKAFWSLDVQRSRQI